ncbi:MAG: hypothetical protein HY040_15560 [Planctomycetes bacterium]|nr:hypothetical protein [Planctomycetota bacterium]
MVWLTVREVLPLYTVGEPPAFTIDLTDEVNTGSGAANWIEWTVHYQGKPVGSCYSAVRRQADRTYELKTNYKFHNFDLLNVPPFGKLELKKLQIDYTVTLEGKLQRMSVLVRASPEIEGVVDGEVEKGFLKSKGVLRGGDTEFVKGDLPPVKVSEMGSVLNPMHLVNRIRGLHVGRTWSEPMIDSFAPISAAVDLGLKKKSSYMMAEVFADTLDWSNTPAVECYRIDHWEPGEKVSARTWVRRRDDIVLKQEAAYEGLKIIVERVPTK